MMNMFKHLKLDSFTYSEHMIKNSMKRWYKNSNVVTILRSHINTMRSTTPQKRHNFEVFYVNTECFRTWRRRMDNVPLFDGTQRAAQTVGDVELL